MIMIAITDHAGSRKRITATSQKQDVRQEPAQLGNMLVKPPADTVVTTGCTVIF